MALSVPGFLEEVHRLHLLEQTDRALDVIFHWIDEDLKRGGEAANHTLAQIDVDSYDEDILVGFLSSTYPGRHVLPARVEYAEKMRQRLERDIGAEDARSLVDDLL